MLRVVVLGALFAAGVPFCVEASVVISEVAWMGSAENANAEWIELYNDGPSVDLTDWTLSAIDGQPTITLSGTLGANKSALLERTSDDTVPSVPAFLIYSGALGNTGELLELRNSNGSLIDSVDGSDGWGIGGSNETKETLQREGNPPTGRWTTGSPTPEGTVSESVGNEETESSETKTTKASTGSNILFGEEEGKVEVARREPALTISIGEDMTVAKGTKTTFLAKAYKENGTEIIVSNVEWNFGDGTTEKGREVTHTFWYVGDYIVSAVGHRSGFLKEIQDEDRIVVHVVEASLEIAQVSNNFIEIKNTGDETENMSGYVLVSGNNHFTFPKNTFVLPKTTVRFLNKTTGIVRTEQVSLFTPNGEIISQYSDLKVPTHTVKSSPVYSGTPVARKEEVLLKEETETATGQTTLKDEILVSEEDAETASVYLGSDERMAKKDTDIWWWILGLFTAIVTAIVAVFLVRSEQQEVLEGFIIESDE